LSLNSLFNLDDTVSPKNFMIAANNLNHNKWISQLKNQGYQFKSFDFFEIDNIENKGTVCLYPNGYVNQIFFSTAFPAIWTILSENIDTYNSDILYSLYNEIKSNHNYPTFIWGHLLIPHLPIFRNQNGDKIPKTIFSFSRLDSNQINDYYKDYNFYANKIVLNMLNKVPDWKNKTIIISGDHGARILIDENDPRQFTTFAAIYLPKLDTSELKKIKYLQQIPLHIH
jgi:hypothetical protein